MSHRSVSPFSPGPVNPDSNPTASHAGASYIPPQIDDIDPENEYLNNLRSPFAQAGSMSDPFPQQNRRGVPFTVASTLRPTDYKEEWVPKERRSDAYLAVQVQILTYLNTHAADELTTAQAHFFTENAGTKPYGPSAKQAVELCYFMRSHGFDTYVKMDAGDKKIRLYVANRDTRDRSRDNLYWEQDLQTGESLPMSGLRGVGGARRGALGNIFEGVRTGWQ
ncbi:hypothetical protein SLS60_006846 [Paraconiothyrium brasiliense]|uniref:Uncharacterized protein n=1 Tax=Paraconiothyrium brasiliense TaxID=300254 RepID=A0ABR3R7P4_9PLEO